MLLNFYLSREAYNAVLMTVDMVWSFKKINHNPSTYIEQDAYDQTDIDIYTMTKIMQEQKITAYLTYSNWRGNEPRPTNNSPD